MSLRHTLGIGSSSLRFTPIFQANAHISSRCSSTFRTPVFPTSPVRQSLSLRRSLSIRPNAQAESRLGRVLAQNRQAQTRSTPFFTPSPLKAHQSIFSKLFLRTFSSSPKGSIRQTYFPRGSGGYGPPPPKGSWFSNVRKRLDALPVNAVIYALIGLNIAVYLLWQYAIQSWQRFRDPSLHHFLMRNFVLSEVNIMAGRVWTLVTSCFSHSAGYHIFINCFSLYFIAPAVAQLIGVSAFLALYLGGGTMASVVSLMWHRYKKDRWIGSEGASGAIYASLAFYAALFPTATFLLFFIIPVPAWLAIGGVFAYDSYSALKTRGGAVFDHAGHVGGLLAGLIGAAIAKRRGFGGRFRPF